MNGYFWAMKLEKSRETAHSIKIVIGIKSAARRILKVVNKNFP
jgi:hypothetical protein